MRTDLVRVKRNLPIRRPGRQKQARFPRCERNGVHARLSMPGVRREITALH